MATSAASDTSESAKVNQKSSNIDIISNAQTGVLANSSSQVESANKSQAKSSNESILTSAKIERDSKVALQMMNKDEGQLISPSADDSCITIQPFGALSSTAKCRLSELKKLLRHTESLKELPEFGVKTSNEKELSELMVQIDVWGLNIFEVHRISQEHSLTVVMYKIFEVSLGELSWIFEPDLENHLTLLQL